MTQPNGWLVTAHLASPLAGDPPMLDGLLEYAVANRGNVRAQGIVSQHGMDRAFSCPPPGLVPIAISRRDCDGWPVPCCSSPILSAVRRETVDHVVKKLAVEHACLLAPSERTVVATTNGAFKSYRLPLRIRTVDAVHWICLANYRELKKQCRAIWSLGKKRSIGYGKIRKWIFTPYHADHWWFADSVLMRPLPAAAVPDGTRGAKQDYGACVPPYWHSDRWCSIVIPV